MNFFEEAKAIVSLISEWEITQEEIANRLGKAQSTIANKIRLLKLTKREQTIIVNSNLTERHSRALLKIDDKDIRYKALNFIIHNKLNVNQTDEYIDNFISGIIDIDGNNVLEKNFECDIDESELNQNKNINKCKNKKMKIPIVKDIRLFLNSINKAIDTMKSAGVNAYTKKNETDNYVEYVVRIPLSSN